MAVMALNMWRYSSASMVYDIAGVIDTARYSNNIIQQEVIDHLIDEAFSHPGNNYYDTDPPKRCV